MKKTATVVRRTHSAVRRPAIATGPYGAWIRFICLFTGLFLIASKIHQVTRDRTAPTLIGALHVRPSTALISVLTPSEGVTSFKNLILGHTTIVVGQGCDGLDGLMLLISAILAFPVAWQRRLVGLLVGVPLLYSCNLMRITGLYYTRRYWPLHFRFVHEVVGQTFIVMVGCCFFLLWAGSSSRVHVE